MARRKNQVQEMGKLRGGLSGPLEVHCRTDNEGNAKFQECLAQFISQMDNLRRSNCQPPQQQQKQSQLVSPLTQLFSNKKLRNMNTKKVLVSITVLGSAGPLRVILDSNATANEVIKQALAAYSKEGRRPALGLNFSCFELRYLQEPSQVLEPNERIGGLGFRQFQLSKKKDASTATTTTTSGIHSQNRQSPDAEGGNSWWSNLMASVAPGLFLQSVGSNTGKAQQLHIHNCF
eukprot:Gb_13149 [translate_table: standard]